MQCTKSQVCERNAANETGKEKKWSLNLSFSGWKFVCDGLRRDLSLVCGSASCVRAIFDGALSLMRKLTLNLF